MVYLTPRETFLTGLESPLAVSECLGAAAIAMEARDDRRTLLDSLSDADYWGDSLRRRHLDHEASVLAGLARRLATEGASDFGRMIEARLLGADAV